MHEPRQQAADEQVADGDAGHDAVEDERQRRREEQAERTRAVSRPSENRSRYRSARSAGSRSPPSARIVTPDPPVNDREERAQHRGDDRRAAGHPSEERAEQAQQAVGGVPLGQQEPGQREERDGRKVRRGELVVAADDGVGRAVALGQEQEDGGAAQQREDRHAQRPPPG